MLPTVTIESTRAISGLTLELLIGGLIVVAAIAWVTMSRLRHRHR